LLAKLKPETAALLSLELLIFCATFVFGLIKCLSCFIAEPKKEMEVNHQRS
jgi:hypothetical protein